MNDSFLRSKIMKKIFAAALLAFILCFTVSTQTSGDASLRNTTQLDGQDRDKNGKLITLSADEHLRRGLEAH